MQQAPEAMTLKVIAHIHTAFPTKFGIPRQSGLVPETRATIVFEPEYHNPDALRGLEGKGILALQQYKGRAKKVVLTEAGREYAAQTAGRLFAAEVRALEAWPTEEINEYICLMEKYVAGLRAQIEQL